MLGDHQPFTKLVTSLNGDQFWITRSGALYFPYMTRKDMAFGIASPALWNLYNQQELKELYDNTPTTSDFV